MLMNDETMQNMINKQGALLKFKHHFNLLVKDRDLEPIHVEDEEEKEGKEKNAESGRLSLETIKEESKIYGRYNKQSKLSEWQKAVNKAAFDLCAQEPDKMYDQMQLKYAAEEEARKTYVFKKAAGSRSKFNEGEPQKIS